MFNDLQALPADPLLGLITKFRNDTKPNKIDLGVGVYKDEAGVTPVLASVKQAESFILENEDSKAYVGPAGNVAYTQAISSLVFGEHLGEIQDRLVGLQTPGGCGALRVLAETIKKSGTAPTLWVSDPTWANHVPLLGGAGLTLQTYPYYDFERTGIRFEAMLAALNEAKAGDVVLLHGCCHNPSGADLTQVQWQSVIELCRVNKLVPLIDVAYQGFGASLDEDAYGVRLAAQTLPEVMVAISCSKNFGLYRERVGAAFVLADSAKSAQAITSHMLSITRGIYSMPPSHGACIVESILGSEELSTLWRSELSQMRTRIQSMRLLLVNTLNSELAIDRFDFIKQEKGMFSFLGVNQEQVAILAEHHGIYMADSSRISVAGLSEQNIPYFVQCLAKVL